MPATTYRASYPDLVAFMARRGFLLKEIATELQVGVKTLGRWRAKYPELDTAFQTNRRIADAQVEGALFRKARGFSYSTQRMDRDGRVVTVVVTEPPDTGAMCFWLKNRLPDEWRDIHRSEITGKEGGAIRHEHDFSQLTDEELEQAIVREAEGITGRAATETG